MVIRRNLVLLVAFLVLGSANAGDLAAQEHGVNYASKCEACKYLAAELTYRLSETGKTSEILEIGYSLDDVKPKKRKEYKKSELRLLESLENVCDRILQYNLHKERKDSTRFAKGMSQTFQTLHGLVNKGVKVDLGIPVELWDSPGVEVTQMKQQCETLLEENEESIEKWYFHHQGEKDLVDYLCRERALGGTDKSCLDEKFDKGTEDVGDKKKKKSKKNEL